MKCLQGHGAAGEGVDLDGAPMNKDGLCLFPVCSSTANITKGG